MDANYRIQDKNGLLLNSNGETLMSGSGVRSWFTLEEARNLVDYSKDQRIVESDGANILWEVF